MNVLGIDWILKSGGLENNVSVYFSGHSTVYKRSWVGNVSRKGKSFW